ncbi:MAG: hemerythrin family protein [Clostridiales bacterium]|nr:hemerythrin family protein [Clostridiales bacterium]
MKYEMKQEYFLGIEKIDTQHARLLELMDEAHSLLKDENKLYKCADIRKILAGIKEYVNFHFTDEEQYMQEIGYTGLEEHKKLHQAFAIKVDEFDVHVSNLSLGTQDGMILELLDYLKAWIQEHICEEDRKYVSQTDNR